MAIEGEVDRNLQAGWTGVGLEIARGWIFRPAREYHFLKLSGRLSPEYVTSIVSMMCCDKEPPQVFRKINI